MSNGEIISTNYTTFKDNVDGEYEAVKLHVTEKINIGILCCMLQKVGILRDILQIIYCCCYENFLCVVGDVDACYGGTMHVRAFGRG